MNVCQQTLVLIDNDATVSEVNQKLVKSTLKYMFYHIPEDHTFCLDTYEHDVSGNEDFTGEASDLVFAADKLEFAAKDSNLSDTLCEIITKWRQSDFACRNILVFTDGLEGASINHEKEELYYLIENSEYPVYIVMLEQENNADAKKGLSAISVTSGGKLFESDFPGSDAAVDKQLSEMIFSSMDEYSQVHWMRYEEDDTGIGENEETGEEETVSAEEYETDELTQDVAGEPAMFDGQVVYEYERTPGFFDGSGAIILSAALITAGLLAGILGGLVIMKRRRKAYRSVSRPAVSEEELFDDYELGGMSTTELNTGVGSETVFLSDDDICGGNPTRLLDSPCTVITLTDKGEDKRSYKIALAGPMSIGRGNCDVTITGDDALSKRHCELFEREGDIYVKDLASANGTRVNGVKVREERLRGGDELKIGSRAYLVGMT